MKLFLSNVYSLIISVFHRTVLVFFPYISMEVRTMELIIFTIGTYWFNIASIIKSLIDSNKM